MRILFEILLFAVVVGGVYLFYWLFFKALDYGKKVGKKGFTLIDFLIVTAIIAILLATAIPQIQEYRNRDKLSSTKITNKLDRKEVIKFYCSKCGEPNEVKIRKEN